MHQISFHGYNSDNCGTSLIGFSQNDCFSYEQDTWLTSIFSKDKHAWNLCKISCNILLIETAHVSNPLKKQTYFLSLSRVLWSNNGKIFVTAHDVTILRLCYRFTDFLNRLIKTFLFGKLNTFLKLKNMNPIIARESSRSNRFKYRHVIIVY